VDYTAKAGDVLFYPKNWWHQTLNLETPTIVVAGRLVDETNYPQVYVDLVEKCENRKDITKEYPGAAPPATQELCQELPKCLATWQRTFGEQRAPTEHGCSSAAIDAAECGGGGRVSHEECTTLNCCWRPSSSGSGGFCHHPRPVVLT